MEARACCRLATEPHKPVGLVENGIRDDTGVAVTATVCRLGANKLVFECCINVAAQSQELHAESVVGIFGSIGGTPDLGESQSGTLRRYPKMATWNNGLNT